MIHVERIKCYNADLAETLGIVGSQAITLWNCITTSTCAWVGYVHGEPACMWGLVPPTLLSDHAYLWLLTTKLIEDHKFAFVRHSQIEIKRMLETYPMIVGHCDQRHTDSVQWLKWLGAKFDLSQGPLAPFTIVRGDG